MELVFLDRKNLKYKDHAFISPNFEIVLDAVVSQKSNFTLNKESINASVGDITILRGANINFIGIIETISKNKDKTLKVQTTDFKEIFNVKVPASLFSGDICLFLVNKIKEVFINSDDLKQNLKYLNFEINTSKEGTLSYEENSFINILELIELITKSYNLIIKFKVSYLRGRFNFINVIIEDINLAHKIKNNLKAISNIEINDSKENQINKIIFYPKKENIEHRSTKSYYLLNDGTITEDKNNDLRNEYVSFDSEYYGDDEYLNLETRALSILLKQAKDHEITFDLDLNNKVFIPLDNLFLGTIIDFYYDNKVYHSILTQIKYKNNFATCHITLGEHRSSLTDKIKLISKGGSNSSNSTSGILIAQNTDGGEY